MLSGSLDGGSRVRTRSTVLFVAHVGNFGGSAMSLQTLLRYLDSGLRRVLAGPSPAPFADRLLEEGLVNEIVPMNWRRGRAPLAAARVMWWAIRNRGRLRAIHANGTADYLLSWPAALMTRVPLVVWVHDSHPKRWVVRLTPLIRRGLKEIRWAAVSEFSARALIDVGLASAENVQVVPNPIEFERVEAAREDSPQVRITYLAGDVTGKGFDLLPDVVDRLADSHVKFLLFTTQHANRTVDIQDAWIRLRRMEPDKVRIRGRVADVREAFAQTDILFIPTRSESFCRIAAEAMVNSIPVVASDLPPIRSLLGDNEDAGLLFPAGDVDRAIQCLSRLVDQRSLRDAMGRRGRARTDSFYPGEIAKRFEQLYQKR